MKHEVTQQYWGNDSEHDIKNLFCKESSLSVGYWLFIGPVIQDSGRLHKEYSREQTT